MAIRFQLTSNSKYRVFFGKSNQGWRYEPSDRILRYLEFVVTTKPYPLVLNPFFGNKVGSFINKLQLAHGHLADENETIRVLGAYTVIVRKKNAIIAFIIIASGCDLLVLSTSPDALALGATLQMVEALHCLKTNYKILLTLIPPHPNKTGEEAKKAIAKVELPIFSTGIRRLAVFQKAALEGVPVNQVKGDSYAGIAWHCYFEVGKEILP